MLLACTQRRGACLLRPSFFDMEIGAASMRPCGFDTLQRRNTACQRCRLPDAVAFGNPFIGKPDLPARLLNDEALNSFNPNLLYTPGPQGYSDYQVPGEPMLA